jgi:hypothetical protein
MLHFAPGCGKYRTLLQMLNAQSSTDYVCHFLLTIDCLNYKGRIANHSLEE